MKQRIALHERNVSERKKKLASNGSRSSSPLALSVKPSGSNDGKPPSSPVAGKCAEDTISSGSLVSENVIESQGDLEESYRKEFAECMNKMEHHKLLEEREQMTVTELTNQLTECVSEIEEHERMMDCVQKQLADLHKQLEVGNVCVYWLMLIQHTYVL